jgi:hypothetical protein
MCVYRKKITGVAQQSAQMCAKDAREKMKVKKAPVELV